MTSLSTLLSAPAAGWAVRLEATHTADARVRLELQAQRYGDGEIVRDGGVVAPALVGLLAENLAINLLAEMRAADEATGMTA